MKHPIAQTNLQLYNQLVAAGYSDDDLALVRNAYEFGIELFTGTMTTSRKVFLEHGVGSASVLAQIGEPATMVAAGMLHNVFWSGVWKDGLKGITKAKREEVRRRVGDEILPCLLQFHTLRWNEVTAADLVVRFDELDQTMYQTILLRVADHIDHLLDGGLMYAPHSSERLERAQKMLEPIVTLAEKLGYPELGAETRALTESAARMKVPQTLRNRSDQTFSEVIAPRSHLIAPLTKLRQIAWRGLGIRKAIRSLFQGGKNS